MYTVHVHVLGIIIIIACAFFSFYFIQGYLFVSVVMNEGHELMPLVIQAIRHDLESRNPTFNILSMQCVANIASKEMAEQLGKDVVPNLIVSP